MKQERNIIISVAVISLCIVIVDAVGMIKTGTDPDILIPALLVAVVLGVCAGIGLVALVMRSIRDEW